MELATSPWQDDALLRLIVDGMREAGGDWIVAQYVVHARAPFDDRPDDCLDQLSSDLVNYEKPLTLARTIRTRAWAFERAYPGCPEIHRGFVPALRELVDFFVRHKPNSPTRAERITIAASELACASQVSSVQIRILGHLLEEEGVGRVEWGDDASSWTIEPGLQILRFRRVAMFDDFLRIVLDRVPD